MPKKIGIYTDIHCSYTSSILPIHCEGSKYTTRLQMVIDTFKWMYELFNTHSVDLIVNCGDLFDSHSVRAEEIAALSDGLGHSSGIPELHILGNHEILDKRRNFYATALLKNYSHIEVIEVPTKWENGLSFLPYMDSSEAEESMPMLKNDILFSHIDIKGSKVSPQYELDFGVDPITLNSLFKRVINGHLHSPQSFSIAENIGAATSLSFSDSPTYTPSVTILDTKSLRYERFNNPYAIRFIKADINTVYDLAKIMEDVKNPVVLKLKVAFSQREGIEQKLKEYNNVITYRVHTDKVVTNNVVNDAPTELNTSQDVCGKFIEFINQAELKYPLENYVNFVNELSGGAKS